MKKCLVSSFSHLTFCPKFCPNFSKFISTQFNLAQLYSLWLSLTQLDSALLIFFCAAYKIKLGNIFNKWNIICQLINFYIPHGHICQIDASERSSTHNPSDSNLIPILTSQYTSYSMAVFSANEIRTLFFQKNAKYMNWLNAFSQWSWWTKRASI